MQTNTQWAVRTVQQTVDQINNHDVAGITQSPAISNEQKGYILDYLSMYPDLNISNARFDTMAVDASNTRADVAFTAWATPQGHSQLSFKGVCGVSAHSPAQISLFVIDQLPLLKELSGASGRTQDQGGSSSQDKQSGMRS